MGKYVGCVVFNLNMYYLCCIFSRCYTLIVSQRRTYSMKKILVAGGAGFIGSHLCGRLLAEGNHVICMDNFFTGCRDNICGYIGNPEFEMVEHNVQIPFDVEVDEIYNLACPASPIHYQYDPIDTIRTCMLGTMNGLDLALAKGAKFLQASTSEVYGDPLEHPQHESYWGNVNPVGIRSCYDEGKRCAETMCMDYHRQRNVNVKIIRIFNTYGPRMLPNDGRVVSNMIVQALKGENLTVFGDGSQTRSFQYIDDLIEGMLRMMATEDGFTGPVNIGNPSEFTILELAQLVLEISGSKSKIIFKDLPSDDPKRRKPDIGLARRKLDGWEPRVPLREGLAHTIDFFKTIV